MMTRSAALPPLLSLLLAVLSAATAAPTAAPPISGEPIPAARGEIPWQELFALRLLAPSLAEPGRDIAFHAQVYGPYDGAPREGVAMDATLELDVLEGEEVVARRLEAVGRTDARGEWVGALPIPENAVRGESGELTVLARAGGQVRSTDTWPLVIGATAYLSTDKTLYRPGERLRIRSLWTGSAPPPAGARTRFEVTDPHGRRVFDRGTALSAHGVAHTAWQIPETALPGLYRVAAEVDGVAYEADRRVRIKPFERAPFAVTVEPERSYFLPGQEVAATVAVRTLLGAPVAGAAVELTPEWWPAGPGGDGGEPAPRPVARGTTGEDGRVALVLDPGPLWDRLLDDLERWIEHWHPPYRDVVLTATARHPVSDRQEAASAPVRLSAEPIHVYAVDWGWEPPEGRPLFVTTFDAGGAPLACRVTATLRRKGSSEILATAELATDRFGAASLDSEALFAGAPRGEELVVRFEARGPAGGAGHRTLPVRLDDQPPPLAVETGGSLLAPGEPVTVRLRPRRPTGRVLVELQQRQRVVDSRVVGLDRGTVELELGPAGAAGPLVLAVHRLDPPPEDSFDPSLLALRRFLVVGEEALALRLEADAEEYRPGGTARVRLSVDGARGAGGRAVLGVAAVDRAVELRQRQEELGDGPALLEPVERWAERTLGEWSLRRIAALPAGELPAGLEAVAGVLLTDVEPLHRWEEVDSPIGESRQRYRNDFERQLGPIGSLLDRARRRPLPVQPTDPGELRALLADPPAGRRIDLDALRDPWGNAYRFAITVRADERRVVAETAGRDGRWGTVDDFAAWSHSWKYFAPLGHEIFWTLWERLASGELVRDRASLERVLAARGVDLSAARDPWGNPYRYELVAGGGHYGWEVWSPGEDGECHPAEPGRPCGLRVWTASVDYGHALARRLGEEVRRVLQEMVGEAGSGAEGERAPEPAELERALRERVGFPWPDPWGRAFRFQVEERIRYTDMTVHRTGDGGQGFLESEPVIARDLVVLARSDGPDRVAGTDDDQTATRWFVPVEWRGRGGEGARLAPGAGGEGEGVLSGLVSDSRGAPLPGVRIEVSAAGTPPRTQLTNADGRFVLALPAGGYRLSASLEGFSTVEYQEVRVRAGLTTWIEVTLSAAVEDVITVASESPPLESRQARTETAEPPPIATPRLRRDFPDTLLWLPEVVTDADGEARIEVPLADTITTWRLAALASTRDGLVATGTLDLRVSRPFFIEPDPPPVVTAGDRLAVPVYASNLTDHGLELEIGLELEGGLAPEGGGVAAEDPGSAAGASAGGGGRRLAAPPGAEVRADLPVVFPVSYPEGGEVALRVTAVGGGEGDAVERTVAVRPDGRAVEVVTSRLAGGRPEAVEIVVPEAAIPGTATLEVAVFPDLRSHLVAATAELLRRPTGCAEQVVSAAYPSLLLLRLAADGTAVPEELGDQARAHLAAGLDRLRAVQRQDGAFSYWARPGGADVALTAYALELLVAAEELGADGPASGTLQGARAAAGWLVSHQDADGMWSDVARAGPGRGPGGPYGGPAAPEVERRQAALAAGALARWRAAHRGAAGAEGAEDGLAASVEDAVARTLAALAAPAGAGHDPYLSAAYALAAHAHGEPELAERAEQRLRELAVDGREGAFWELRTNTPFAGWGLSGRNEVTALAVRALLADGADGRAADGHAERGLAYLLRGHGAFGLWGSTQATAQALRALAVGLPSGPTEGAGPDAAAGGALPELQLDGAGLDVAEAGEERFGPHRAGPEGHPALARLAPGRHWLTVGPGGGASTLVQASLRYWVPWDAGTRPVVPGSEDLVFERRCAPLEVTVGEPVRCRVRAGRRGHRGRGMLIAEVGLPPGAEVDRRALEEAIPRVPGFDHFEVWPDRVVLYLWPRSRALDGGVEVTVPFTPRFAAKARSTRSLLYDYYNPAARQVLAPEEFRVEAEP